MQIVDSSKWFDNMLEEAKTHDEFWFEGARIRIAEAIYKKMKTLNIDETTLAEMVGCKKQSITRIMMIDTKDFAVYYRIKIK